MKVVDELDFGAVGCGLWAVGCGDWRGMCVGLDCWRGGGEARRRLEGG